MNFMSITKSIRAQIPPIHPEGYPFIGGFALASLILFWIWTPLGWIGTCLRSGAPVLPRSGAGDASAGRRRGGPADGRCRW